ncbi:MAG: chromosome segregation protein SMC, partial [Nitrospirae bacterium]|nr:chromosome segregation protein SMC [Nitrospirota bacterium]
LLQIEQALTGIAEGIAIEELEKQGIEIDPNSLPAKIEALERRLKDELEPQIRDLSEKKGAARNELQRMDGSSKAAQKEEEAQQALAKVRRLAEYYVRLRIAAQVLKREVDRYRHENQDPILKIASRYFSELTVGAFSSLRADIDDDRRPILIGVCQDERPKTVKDMSSGTRDQLYLALRLATLEWRLQKHEPMPFIADDILVNFDDARAKATLKALATLAEKNQVILFTHHVQIVETAKALGQNDRVFVHPLNTTNM